MFVMSSVPDIKSELKGKQEKVETVITTCEKSKEVMSKNLKDQENALRDLVNQKKESK
jgi:prefoldin subunit 1